MHFTLRPWTQNDLTSLIRHGSNPNIAQFMSDAFPDTDAKWRTFLDFATKDENILYFAIDIDGEAVGGIGVKLQKESMLKNAELGYWLSEEYWGQGIMTDAVKKMVQLAFAKMEIDRIFATPYSYNTASHRVLEKAGFRLEGKIEETVSKKGVLLDELIYEVRKTSNQTYL